MLEFTEPIPRICTVAAAPGWPLVVKTWTPGEAPSRAEVILDPVFFVRLATSIRAAEPVKEFLVCVP